METDLNNLSPAELAQRIDSSRQPVQVKQDSHHCRRTCTELRKLGWSYAKIYSTYSSRVFEEALQKDGYRLVALASSFQRTGSEYRVYSDVS